MLYMYMNLSTELVPVFKPVWSGRLHLRICTFTHSEPELIKSYFLVIFRYIA